MKELIPYLRYLKPYKKIFIFAILCGLVFGVMSGLGIPIIFEKVFRRVFEASENKYAFWQIGLLAAGVPAAFAVRGIFNFINIYLMSKCGLYILRGLRRDIFKKMQELPISFFDRSHSGDLINRLIHDPDMVQHTLLELAAELFNQPLQMIGAIIGLIYLTAQYGEVLFLIIFLCSIPICILPVRIIRKRLKMRGREAQEANSRMTQHITENFGSVQEIRSFNLEGLQKEEFNKRMDNYITHELKLVQYQRTQQPLMEVISSVIVAVVFLYAYYSDVPFSVFSAMGLALYFAADPIKRVTKVINQAHRSIGAIERINEVLNEYADIKDPETPIAVDRLQGAVAYKGVTFSYGKQPAINNISVDIAAGTSCALVGLSGAGKSTFVKLLPRFYDPQEGIITIDGLNIKDMTLFDLRRHIGIVPQHPVLFHDTIFNNIKLGAKDVTDEAVYQAAKDAYAHAFIEALDQGYHTMAGERGDRLSGGQKQRIAIARAFLKSAPILILDEATSALDSQSEHYIQKALAKLTKHKTVFTIAHRLSTIKHADTILVFEQGSIIARGTHEELTQSCAVYKDLVQKQSLQTS